MDKPYSAGLESGWTEDPVETVLRGGVVVESSSGNGLCVSRGRIAPECEESPPFEIDISGLRAYPAPINAHDHLLGTWTPKVGKGPYRNVYEWLEELHDPDAPVRRERDINPAEDIYLLGTYKNIVSGTASVNDHYIRRPDHFWEQFPMRIFHRFGRTWTLRSETGWGGTIEEELADAGSEYPYIIHVSEGVDEETGQELKALASRGGVRSNSLLVHGIAFGSDDLDLIAEKGASIAWCPTSNMFLYGKTLNVPAAMERGINICLGTDSTLSGYDNVFDEARFAAKTYKELYGSELSADVVFNMMTANAAKAFLADGEVGCLSVGALADVLVIGPKDADPTRSYLQTRPEDVDLLLVGGKPAFGNVRHADYFDRHCETHSIISVNGTDKAVVGDPAALLSRIEKKIGFKKDLPFLQFDR